MEEVKGVNLQCSTGSSTNSSTSASPKCGKSDRTYDNLVSSFTIRTAKPWTMVSGYDGQGVAMKVKQAAVGPIRGGNNKRASVPTLPAVNPYTLGARRASANGDRALIESLGLVPNQSFKATKIIQHYPPNIPFNETITSNRLSESEPKMRTMASISEIERPRSSSDSESAKSLTFHCLQFGECKVDSSSQNQFIASEYQGKVCKKRHHSKPEAALEAAQLLLDFTRAAK